MASRTAGRGLPRGKPARRSARRGDVRRPAEPVALGGELLDQPIQFGQATGIGRVLDGLGRLEEVGRRVARQRGQVRPGTSIAADGSRGEAGTSRPAASANPGVAIPSTDDGDGGRSAVTGGSDPSGTIGRNDSRGRGGAGSLPSSGSRSSSYPGPEGFDSGPSSIGDGPSGLSLGSGSERNGGSSPESSATRSSARCSSASSRWSSARLASISAWSEPIASSSRSRSRRRRSRISRARSSIDGRPAVGGSAAGGSKTSAPGSSKASSGAPKPGGAGSPGAGRSASAGLGPGSAGAGGGSAGALLLEGSRPAVRGEGQQQGGGRCRREGRPGPHDWPPVRSAGRPGTHPRSTSRPGRPAIIADRPAVGAEGSRGRRPARRGLAQAVGALRATFSQVWTWGSPWKYQAKAGPSSFQTSQTPSLPMSPSL